MEEPKMRFFNTPTKGNVKGQTIGATVKSRPGRYGSRTVAGVAVWLREQRDHRPAPAQARLSTVRNSSSEGGPATPDCHHAEPKHKTGAGNCCRSIRRCRT